MGQSHSSHNKSEKSCGCQCNSTGQLGDHDEISVRHRRIFQESNYLADTGRCEFVEQLGIPCLSCVFTVTVDGCSYMTLFES